MQPLLRDPAARSKISWVNSYSKLDVFSGAPEFCQLLMGAGPTGPEVRNIEDPQAITPLMAHAQYKTNPLLFAEIRAAIFT